MNDKLEQFLTTGRTAVLTPQLTDVHVQELLGPPTTEDQYFAVATLFYEGFELSFVDDQLVDYKITVSERLTAAMAGQLDLPDLEQLRQLTIGALHNRLTALAISGRAMRLSDDFDPPETIVYIEAAGLYLTFRDDHLSIIAWKPALDSQRYFASIAATPLWIVAPQ